MTNPQRPDWLAWEPLWLSDNVEQMCVVLGRLADRLVDLGGSIVLGEIAEIMGAEQLLAERAASPTIAARLIQVVSRVTWAARLNASAVASASPTSASIMTFGKSS